MGCIPVILGVTGRIKEVLTVALILLEESL